MWVRKKRRKIETAPTSVLPCTRRRIKVGEHW
jgi:hypothetical protein